MSKAKPDFIITASDLQKAFESDEKEASTMYINRILEVTGTIASVQTSGNNTITISLITESDFFSVLCTFPAITDTTKFTIGDEITLRGECSGFLMDVLLNNCAVVQKHILK